MDAAVIARLYEGGMSSQELGARLGVSYRTVLRRVREAGGQARPCGVRRTLPRGDCEVCGKELRSAHTRAHAECRRKYPPATPRECELDTCDKVFVPQVEKAARGAGRFCSYAHWNEWRTGRPQREWRAA